MVLYSRVKRFVAWGVAMAGGVVGGAVGGRASARCAGGVAGESDGAKSDRGRKTEQAGVEKGGR